MEAISKGTQICEALGLDPSVTQSITIKITPHNVVVTTVEMFLKPESVEKFNRFLAEYELVEKSREQIK